MLSTFTVGAVALGAAFGIVPSAVADPAGGQRLLVDIVGDSYMTGEGNYLDPADPRHRSLAAPALQALSRVADENPGIEVDANVVASAGAVTADYFSAQLAPDASVVNTPQHDQIRPNAQVVIVGFGGTDAELAQVLSIVKPSNGTTPGDLDAKVKNFSGLLDISGSDQTYLDQASTSPFGQAPTLVSRMLQVLAGISERAPQARIFVTTYPLAVDPDNPHSLALIKKRDLITVQKFVFDLNETIERAVRICACANLVDMSNAFDGHEVYTGKSAYQEPAADQPHASVVIQPNEEGAALMAGPLAKDIADWLGVTAPKPRHGKVELPRNITARSGESDIDGDLVPDFDDEAPHDSGKHHRKSDRPDTPPTPDASHHGKASDAANHGKGPDTTHHGKGSGVDGRRDKDRGPAGDIPIRPVLPSSPAPKREYDPEHLPQNQRVAEPDMAERRPAPDPRAPGDDVRAVPVWQSEHGERSDVGRFVPESEVESVDVDPDVVREALGPQASEDDVRAARAWLSEHGELTGVEWFVPEPADFGEEVRPEREPLEARGIVGWAGEERTAQEETGSEENSPEGDGSSTEPAETEPVESEVPRDSVVFTPVLPDPVGVVPEQPEAPSDPVEVVLVEPAPVVEAPVPDEATDGQQVCILIYPAPAGCGGPEGDPS